VELIGVPSTIVARLGSANCAFEDPSRSHV